MPVFLATETRLWLFRVEFNPAEDDKHQDDPTREKSRIHETRSRAPVHPDGQKAEADEDQMLDSEEDLNAGVIAEIDFDETARFGEDVVSVSGSALNDSANRVEHDVREKERCEQHFRS